MSRAGTQKQMEILKFIESFQEENGYSPTVREICTAVGLSSTSTVHSHLLKLTQQGYLQRDGRKSRVTRVVQDLDKKESEKIETTHANAAVKAAPVQADDAFLLQHRIDNIPVIGDVAAGVPILAEENVEDAFPLPVDFVRGDSSDTFILNVHGDSMINAGILSGDKVVVRPQPSADDGQIVVARIEDEATVKRLRRRSGQIWLMPENDNYSPIDGTNAEIIGVVKAVVREY